MLKGRPNGGSLTGRRPVIAALTAIAGLSFARTAYAQSGTFSITVIVTVSGSNPTKYIQNATFNFNTVEQIKAGYYLITIDPSTIQNPNSFNIVCFAQGYETKSVPYNSPPSSAAITCQMTPSSGNFAIQFQQTGNGPYVSPANIQVFIDVQGNVGLPLHAGVITWGNGNSLQLNQSNLTAIANGGGDVSININTPGSYMLTCSLTDSKTDQALATTAVVVVAPPPPSTTIYHDYQSNTGSGWAGGAPFGGSALQLGVARNSDGRLEVFYVGANSDLYHRWQLTPAGLWSSEESLGVMASQLAVGQNQDGRLEVFFVGSDTLVHHMWQLPGNGGWNGSQIVRGSNATSVQQIAVGRNADGRLEIFYVGWDGKSSDNTLQLFHNWQEAPNSDWAGEQQFSGDSAKQVAVASNSDGRLEIFYVGTNSNLYHNWQTAPNGSWAGEHYFNGDSAKQITVARNADGRLEIFYIGTNNDLYHNWQVTPGSSTWNGESQFPHDAGNQVDVAPNRDGRLEIFYVGTDSHLNHNWQITPNGDWAGETRIDGMASLVRVFPNSAGNLEIFYLAQTGRG